MARVRHTLYSARGNGTTCTRLHYLCHPEMVISPPCIQSVVAAPPRDIIIWETHAVIVTHALYTVHGNKLYCLWWSLQDIDIPLLYPFLYKQKRKENGPSDTIIV